MNIPKLVREMRKKSGLSQYNFGFQYGLGPHAIARYERGERMPRADVFIKMLLDQTPGGLDADDIMDAITLAAGLNEKT